MKNNIFINKNAWNNLSIEELADYKDKVFNYYRKKGFPYYPTDIDFKTKNYLKLDNFNTNKLIKNNEINQTMHGLNLAWSYFPHSWEISCNNLKTPMDIFNSDNDFKKVIDKRIKFGDNMSNSGIRKTLRIYTGTQSVSNFKPTTAKALYNYFAPNGTVYDMSSGFGGRLLGFLVSEANHYIGVDPSSKTYEGLLNIKNDYINIYSELNLDLFTDKKFKNIDLYKIGSEDFRLDKNSIDFCFTSPPYYNCEKYSNELSQSYIKYPEKEKWTNEFLRKTFKNCHYCLKTNKYMAINIANVKSFINLEEETIRIANESGFKLENTFYYLLSSLSSKNKFKKEPIYIFKKI